LSFFVFLCVCKIKWKKNSWCQIQYYWNVSCAFHCITLLVLGNTILLYVLHYNVYRGAYTIPPEDLFKKNKIKWENNDPQEVTQKTKDRVTRTPLKTGGKLRCSERVSSSCSTSGTRRGGNGV
jgi:hypothetical protein